MKIWMKLAGATATVGLIAMSVWLIRRSVERLQAVEARIAQAEERSQNVLRKMNDYSHELDLAIERARQARRQADDADALRSQAVSKAEHAQTEAEQARASAEDTRKSIEELRQQRRQELDRMQEALNRIAPTRRTPLGMVVEIANDSFKFDFDKSYLRPENREILSRVAGVLLASNGYRLQVYGYTDDIGPENYNQALSERRAQSVAEYLIEAGVPADIVSTKGFGKASPRIRANTPDARQQNRRVEIGIVDTIISYPGADH